MKTLFNSETVSILSPKKKFNCCNSVKSRQVHVKVASTKPSLVNNESGAIAPVGWNSPQTRFCVTTTGNPAAQTPRRAPRAARACSDGVHEGLRRRTANTHTHTLRARVSSGSRQIRQHGARIRRDRFLREMAKPLQRKSGAGLFLWRSAANPLR